MSKKNSIAIAGNIILDIVKNIQVYPEIGMLANISDMSYSVGGCTPNTAINLAKIDSGVSIEALGRVGNDDNGKFIINELKKYGIGTNGVTVSDTTPTSFTDVMSIPSGERTFFHKRGANAEFCPEDIDLDSLDCEILHIGYILLLDKFDAEDEEYGTVMARFLANAQKKGLKTSVDVVSDSTGQFAKKVVPALKYCDYIIINEIECCSIWGLDAYSNDGTPLKDNVRRAMEMTLGAGVKDTVIVHSKTYGMLLNSKGVFAEVPSLKVPPEDIKGTVGAGDSFCAASLYGILNGYEERRILEFASAAAACNLRAANAVDGMLPKDEIIKLEKIYGRLQ